MSRYLDLFPRSNILILRFEEFIDKFGKTDPSNIASVYAFRGEIDNAFQWLNKAYNLPDVSLIQVINVPFLENLYDDPRWNEFLTKLKLPKDHWLLKK